MQKFLLMCVILGVVLYAQQIDVLVWTARASTPAPARCQLQAHGNVRDTIYICGGRTPATTAVRLVHAYVPATNTWISTIPSMPASRSHGSGDVIDSIIYAAGGFDSTGVQQTTFYAFNANSKTWSTRASLPSTNLLGAGAAYGGRFYIFGKQTNSDTLLEYNPGNNTWTTRAPNPRPQGRRVAAAAGTVNYFYVMGGINASNVVLNDCWRYTRMGGGTWTQMANMPGPRCMHAAYAVTGDSVIYVVGGNPTGTGAPCDAVVYKYTIATDTWVTETSMPTARGFLTLERSGNKIYAIGGINGSTIFTTNEEGAQFIGIEENRKKMHNLEFEIAPNLTHRHSSISYHLDIQSVVSLKLYNSYGALIKIIVNQIEEPGIKSISFDGGDLSSGIYFVRLEIDETVQIGKIILLR